MKICVIDNGGQWTHREWRVLRSLGCDADILENTVTSEKTKGYDGIVLSGGAPSIQVESDRLGNSGDIVDASSVPILGICAGAQFLSYHFGGVVGPGNNPEYGRTEIRVTDQDTLFKGIPSAIIVWENHNDEIKKLPRDFILCASSQACKVQAFHHKSKPIFGVQFHPEVNNTQFGRDIFSNFLQTCKS